MKFILTITIVISTLTIFGQSKKAVELQWKIDKNEKLNYLTVMSEKDSTSIEMDYGSLVKYLSDSSINDLKEIRKEVENINDEFKNTDYIMTLSTEQEGIVDVVMVTKPEEELIKTENDSTDIEDAELSEMFKNLSKGVMLRGSVYKSGQIHSFWVKSQQKNLIALFFQLPSGPVKIGDSWSLDVNLIANDHNFVCDSSFHLNQVTLIDLKKQKGETIAVLNYNIVEYVHGDFNSPMFFGNEGGKKETMMKFSHQGTAEFSIDQGRWITYNGTMHLRATGIMTANTKTKFTLTKE